MKPGGQRLKGGKFERVVAAMLREVIGEEPVKSVEDLKRSRVRRGQQGSGAVEPDVQVVGLPLWVECQDARRPDPPGKLAQAVSDCSSNQMRDDWVPVAIVRRSGARGHGKDVACLYLGGLVELLVWAGLLPQGAERHFDFLGDYSITVVQLDARNFLNIVREVERVRLLNARRGVQDGTMPGDDPMGSPVR